jgi:hypothetical protein
MSRKNQIEAAALDYASKLNLGFNEVEAFRRAAEWADRNPINGFATLEVTESELHSTKAKLAIATEALERAKKYCSDQMCEEEVGEALEKIREMK